MESGRCAIRPLYRASESVSASIMRRRSVTSSIWPTKCSGSSAGVADEREVDAHEPRAAVGDEEAALGREPLRARRRASPRAPGRRLRARRDAAARRSGGRPAPPPASRSARTARGWRAARVPSGAASMSPTAAPSNAPAKRSSASRSAWRARTRSDMSRTTPVKQVWPFWVQEPSDSSIGNSEPSRAQPLDLDGASRSGGPRRSRGSARSRRGGRRGSARASGR